MIHSLFSLTYSFILIDLLTLEEEASAVLERIRRFLLHGDMYNYNLPWTVSPSKSVTRDARERAAKIEAIEEHLGIFPDGTFVPLTFRQKIFFGSPLAKLEYKIKKARENCVRIIHRIRVLNSPEDDMEDVTLLREFILECLSPFKRYTLKANNKAYDGIADRTVHWAVYVTAWIFVSGCILFLIYWIFAWSVYQGDDVLKSWGGIFGTGAATDILLVQITKTIILCYLPGSAMQPQLIRIRSVLADISMSYINRNKVNALHNNGSIFSNDNNNNNRSNNNNSNKNSNSNYSNNFSNNNFNNNNNNIYNSYNNNNNNNNYDDENEIEEVSVIQYMSSACRAARSAELRELPSAWLLRQVRNKHN